MSLLKLTVCTGQTLQNGAKPREMNFVPRTTVWSPAVLKKVLLSPARLLQHDSLQAGQQRGTVRAEPPRTAAPTSSPHLVLWDFGPPFLTHPSRNIANGCWETTSEELPTCGTVSSGTEVKPISNPLSIQIVINNFSPWKHSTLPGRRAVPDGPSTHRELEQVSDCTKTPR